MDILNNEATYVKKKGFSLKILLCDLYTLTAFSNTASKVAKGLK